MSSYKPKKSDRFTFGLWTNATPGRPFRRDPTRPRLNPIANIKELGRRNVYGFNYHDDDLIRSVPPPPSAPRFTRRPRR
jgi:xylose isomerase